MRERGRERRRETYFTDRGEVRERGREKEIELLY